MRTFQKIKSSLLSLSLLASMTPALVAAAHCDRPAPGSDIPDLFSSTLNSENGSWGPYTFHTWQEADPLLRRLKKDNQQPRYCLTYTTPDGREIQNPVLRVKPGDHVLLDLVNHMPSTHHAAPRDRSAQCPAPPNGAAPDHAHPGPTMINLHWHGLNIPPQCGKDEAIFTAVAPGETFRYDFKIPSNDPPGLYWYHPHVHMSAEKHLLGGMSSIVVFDGTERLTNAVRGTQEKLIVLRDMLRVHPSVAKGPWRDVSVNGVPVLFPDYAKPGNKPGKIRVLPDKRVFWRIANASADTMFNIQFLSGNTPQMLRIVEIDGIAIAGDDGVPNHKIIRKDSWLLGPGQRVGLVMEGLPLGKQLRMVTLNYTSGGDSHPRRPLAVVKAEQVKQARLLSHQKILPTVATEQVRTRFTDLLAATPVRTRTLYFKKKPDSSEFYLVEEGQAEKIFDPIIVNIKAQSGTIEDWVIQNRDDETHVFHIHQIHFAVLAQDCGHSSLCRKNASEEVDGINRSLRDTVTLSGIAASEAQGLNAYPSLKLRMDFRDPDIKGRFLFHCHILEHEDKGMMGTIEVE